MDLTWAAALLACASDDMGFQDSTFFLAKPVEGLARTLRSGTTWLTTSAACASQKRILRIRHPAGGLGDKPARPSHTALQAPAAQRPAPPAHRFLDPSPVPTSAVTGAASPRRIRPSSSAQDLAGAAPPRARRASGPPLRRCTSPSPEIRTPRTVTTGSVWYAFSLLQFYPVHYG